MAAFAGVSFAMLCVAWVAQYGFALWPCMLCYWQRAPYIAVVVFAGLGLMSAVDAPSRRLVTLLCAGLFALDAGLAIYHVGVEERWWPGPTACGGPVQSISAADLLAAVTQPGRTGCEEAAFRLFGISMAGYNAMAAAGLTMVALWASRRAAWWK